MTFFDDAFKVWLNILCKEDSQVNLPKRIIPNEVPQSQWQKRECETSTKV
jgi:hypothetical protein